MDCPVCQVSMVVIEFNGIELDYCVECMGVWFDRGEIEVLLDQIGIFEEDLKFDFQVPSKVVVEAKRRCPLCDKLMLKVSPRGSDVILDQCPDGDGIWFDAGELRQAISDIWGKSIGEKDLDGVLKSFLGDFFSSRREEN